MLQSEVELYFETKRSLKTSLQNTEQVHAVLANH